MSEDTKQSEPVVATIAFADDDIARVIPGSDKQQDGGQSYWMQLSAQLPGHRLIDAHYGIYTPHWNPATGATESRERYALGKFGVSYGQMAEAPLEEGLIARGYVEAEINRNDRSFSPDVQNAVHSISGGRDMRPLFAASPVKESVEAGVAAMAQLRREGKIGPFETMAGMHVAGEVGTDRRAVSTGIAAAVGRGLAGLPEILPHANPEAGPRMMTRAPGATEAGDWSLGVSYDVNRIARNQFYQGDHAPAKTGDSVTVNGAYAITDSLVAGLYYQNYSNPSDPDHGLNRGPNRISTVGVQVTKSF